MSDDFDILDATCPFGCGCLLHGRQCYECEDGETDLYDEDPINEDPGTMVPCRECRGRGYLRWCPKCGKDVWDIPQDEQEPSR